MSKTKFTKMILSQQLWKIWEKHNAISLSSASFILFSVFRERGVGDSELIVSMFLSFYGGRWQTQGYNTTTYMLRNQIVTGASLNDHTCICISSMFHSHYWCIAKNVFFKFSIFKCMHGFECGFSSQHVFVYHYLKKKKELDKRWKV